MAAFGPPTSPYVVGRRFFATATVAAALFGLIGDARWFAASGAFGIAWWGWDAIWENVLGPLGAWFAGMLTGTWGVASPPDLTVDDTIRLLEDHLTADAVPRHVQIQSALRLAEIYRTNKLDPQRAQDVIARMRARWPDAPELQRVAPSTGAAPGDATP
ncbi:MAG TPA: hypothetical protein VMT21_11010 [Gemmatimonadales bacterium]|nr:hypothetical protein [Gemmatimonadales bacterium]